MKRRTEPRAQSSSSPADASWARAGAVSALAGSLSALSSAARLALLLTLALIAAALAAQPPVPPLTARATDLTGTLSGEQIDALNTRLAALEQRTGSQVAVLIVPTTGDEPIEAYALRVAESWQLGREDVDDGLLLLVAKDDRELRIEVGYGLEGAIPDAVANRIIRERIVPRFYVEDYAGGVNAGLDAIESLIQGEPLPPPADAPEPSGDAWGVLPMLAFAALFLAPLFRRLFGTLLGPVALGGAAAFVAWLIASAVLVSLVVGLVVFFMALGGTGGPGRWATGRRGWGGGFGGTMGRRGGGGFGGGFGGGGGGFGGGGASGRW